MKNWRVIGVSLAVLLGATFVAGYFYGVHRTRQEPSYLIGEQYKVVRTPGGLVEVNTLQKQESFAWQVSWVCPANLCGFMPVANAQISAVAHYTYRIPLAAHWVLERVGDDPLRYRLKVPKPEPKLPVTVDLSTIRVINNGPLFAPAGPAQQKMQAYMQPQLGVLAQSSTYLQAQEEAARKTVEEFARKWMRDGKTEIPSNAVIEVVFSK